MKGSANGFSFFVWRRLPASIVGDAPIAVSVNGVTYKLRIDAAAMKATADALGLVKIGGGLDIAGDGALSISRDILARLAALEEKAALAASE